MMGQRGISDLKGTLNRIIITLELFTICESCETAMVSACQANNFCDLVQECCTKDPNQPKNINVLLKAQIVVA